MQHFRKKIARHLQTRRRFTNKPTSTTQINHTPLPVSCSWNFSLCAKQKSRAANNCTYEIMRGLNHKGRTNSPFTEVVTGVLAVVRAHLSCSLPPLTGLRRFTTLCNTTATKAYQTTSLQSTPAPTCKTEVWSSSAHSYRIKTGDKVTLSFKKNYEGLKVP